MFISKLFCKIGKSIGKLVGNSKKHILWLVNMLQLAGRLSACKARPLRNYSKKLLPEVPQDGANQSRRFGSQSSDDLTSSTFVKKKKIYYSKKFTRNLQFLPSTSFYMILERGIKPNLKTMIFPWSIKWIRRCNSLSAITPPSRE